MLCVRPWPISIFTRFTVCPNWGYFMSQSLTNSTPCFTSLYPSICFFHYVPKEKNKTIFRRHVTNASLEIPAWATEMPMWSNTGEYLSRNVEVLAPLPSMRAALTDRAPLSAHASSCSTVRVIVKKNSSSPAPWREGFCIMKKTLSDTEHRVPSHSHYSLHLHSTACCPLFDRYRLLTINCVSGDTWWPWMFHTPA